MFNFLRRGFNKLLQKFGKSSDSDPFIQPTIEDMLKYQGMSRTNQTQNVKNIPKIQRNLEDVYVEKHQKNKKYGFHQKNDQEIKQISDKLFKHHQPDVERIGMKCVRTQTYSIEKQLLSHDMNKLLDQKVFFTEIDKLLPLTDSQFKLLGRISKPYKKAMGFSHYMPIEYAEAIKQICETLNKTNPKRMFIYSSGHLSNEAAFFIQYFSRLYGITNICNVNCLTHQASYIGMQSTIGKETATIEFEDLEKSDLIFAIGADTNLVLEQLQLANKTQNVIIINSINEVKKEQIEEKKGKLQHIQPKVGSDIALLKGIAKYILENNLENKEFIENHTANFPMYKDDILGTPWDVITSKTGLTRASIESVGKLYGASQKTIFSWGLGITQHLHGSDNVEQIVNLALLRGMFGKEGAGLLPLIRLGNVTGETAMGLTPVIDNRLGLKMIEATRKMVERDKVLHDMTMKENDIVRRFKGYNTMELVEGIQSDEFDLGIFIGEESFLSQVSATFFAQIALRKLPVKMFLCTHLNSTHFLSNNTRGANYIFPLWYDHENIQISSYTDMFNRVHLNCEKNSKSVEEQKQYQRNCGIQGNSEVQIFYDIVMQVFDNKKLFDFSQFNRLSHIRQVISNNVMEYKDIKKKIFNKENPIVKLKENILHEPIFTTQNHKGNFIVNSIPEEITTVNRPLVMTSFNYSNFEGDEKECILKMNKNDIQKYNLQIGQRVKVNAKQDEVLDLIVTESDILEGNCAVNLRQAAQVVSVHVDPRSGTPSFKSTAVTILKNNKFDTDFKYDKDQIRPIRPF